MACFPAIVKKQRFCRKNLQIRALRKLGGILLPYPKASQPLPPCSEGPWYRCWPVKRDNIAFAQILQEEKTDPVCVLGACPAHFLQVVFDMNDMNCLHCKMYIAWTWRGHCDPYACKQKITKDGSAVRVIYFVTVEGQFTRQAQAGRRRQVFEAKQEV